MDDSWQDSVILITSRADDNGVYGTGFVVHQDKQGAYVLTCTHVVDDVGGEEWVKVNDIPAKVIASGPADGIDIAVLLVAGLANKPLLRPYVNARMGEAFKLAGYYHLDDNPKKKLVFRRLRGIFSEAIQAGMALDTLVTLWEMEITSNDELRPGNSGSPVVDENNHVIGIMNTRLNSNKKRGWVTPIEALKEVWPEMPPDLFLQSTVGRIAINNRSSNSSSPPSSFRPISDSVNGSDHVNAEYICYLSNDKLAALFAQIDTKTLEDYGTSYRGIMSLPFGEAADQPDNERKRRIIVSQLSLVQDYLERTAQIGQLSEVLRENGQLNSEWYHLQAVFRAEPWKASDYQVFLIGKIENYLLRLSCSKSNFPGLSREGDTYIPTSTNVFLFNGDVGLYLRGLVRLINVDLKAKAISGTPLYLVLSTDLGRL